MSDGSDRLTFRDPSTFAETGHVDVTLDGKPVDQLNELDCSGGVVWANLWQSDRIVRINTATGTVTGVLDIDLPAGDRPGADVLNGIAAVPGTTDRFYLTGKLWDTLYEVRISG
jgi:glutamine cyclotransferase